VYKTLRFDGPFQGINLAVDSRYLGITQAADALNIILDRGTLLKRDGITEAIAFDDTTDGAIGGIFDYTKNDGTLKTIVCSGSNLYSTVLNGNDWTSSLISTGTLTPGQLTCFQTVNNRAYLCNGSFFKVTDGTALFDANLPNPAAPTVTLVIQRSSYPSGTEQVGTGKLTGVYDYRYTWYSSTWGQESQASQPTQFLTYDNDNRKLSFRQANGTQVTVPNDARITHVRIYRRKTSDGEEDWSFVSEIAVTPNTTAPDSFDDTKNDVDVDRFTKAPIGAPAGTLSNFNYMAMQRQVLFLAGSPTFPSRVYYTLPGRPYVLQGYLDIGSMGDNEKVTGLAAYQGFMVVFKTNSIYVISGDTKETFDVVKVRDGIGCRGHFSIVHADNLLFFLAQKGFYTWDGQNAVEISEQIKPLVINRNQLLDTICVGVHDYERGMILWAFCGPGSNSPNKLMAYYYRNAREIEDDSWCPWAFQSQKPTYLALVQDNTTRIQKLTFGMDSGKLCLYGGDSDIGDPIPYLWKTGKQSGNVPEIIKIWDEATVHFRPTPVSTSINISLYVDENPTPKTFAHDMVDSIFRKRWGRSSRECQWEFQSVTTGACEIVGWTQRAEAGKAA